jgi:hypothetical protein
MRSVLTFLLLTCVSSSFAQKRQNVFPIWSYHARNLNITGLSVGLGTLWENDEAPRNTNTNGIKLELIGTGILIPLKPDNAFPVDTDSALNSYQMQPRSERINGISLTGTGTVCNCVVNGASAALFWKLEHKVNGVSAALWVNTANIHNGIQAAGLFNVSYIGRGIQIGGFNEGDYFSGVQIGLVNYSRKLRGIQIGLWNINERRKFPIINWNFKKQQ